MIFLFKTSQIQLAQEHLIFDADNKTLTCNKCNTQESLDIPSTAKELFDKMITFIGDHHHNNNQVEPAPKK